MRGSCTTNILILACAFIIAPNAIAQRALDTAESHVNRGATYVAEKRFDEAITEFEEALRIKPQNLAIKTKLVAALEAAAGEALTAGAAEKALAHLIRAKALEPSNPDVFFKFAIVALRLSLYDDAAQALVAALEKRPNEPTYTYALARARMGKGELPEAEKLFRRYITLRPDDATGFYGLGYVLTLQKKSAEAEQQFQKSLALQPTQTEAPYQLGLIALANGDLERAASWFNRVLGRAQNHAGALLGMGLVSFHRKDYPAAREHLERSLAIDSSPVKAHYQLGLTYARLGEKEASERELKLAETMARDEKNKKRTVLRLFNERDATDRAAGAQRKP